MYILRERDIHRKDGRRSREKEGKKREREKEKTRGRIREKRMRVRDLISFMQADEAYNAYFISVLTESFVRVYFCRMRAHVLGMKLSTHRGAFAGAYAQVHKAISA